MGEGKEQEPQFSPMGLAWQAAAKYGLWAVVALALGYVLIGEVRADVKMVRQEHSAMSHTLQRLEWYAWRTCLNTANTEAERAGCTLPEQAR